MSHHGNHENETQAHRKEGEMTVREAGHLGGEKGGEKGGERVAELIEKGKEAEQRGGGNRDS